MACVLGEIDLVRALHIGAVPCVVVAGPGEPVRYTRAAVRAIDRIATNTYPQGMLDRLLEFASAEPEPPVLFYDGDFDLLLVSRYRDRLAGVFRFVVPDAALVEAVLDKGEVLDLAQRFELPVPPGRVLRAGDQLPKDLGLDFPLALKPLIRDHATWRPISRSKAVRLESRQALDKTAARLAESSLDAVIQELVPGSEDRIESYHVYVDRDLRVRGEFTGRKLRTFPSEFGYTTALEITDRRDVRDLGREVVGRIGLRGVAKLDFKRGPDDRLWLLDINPRFNLWHHAGAVAGVNIPLMVYRDLAGLPSPPAQRARPGVRWCTLRHDFLAARASNMGPVAWLAFVASCDAISGFSLSDPLPLPRAAIARLRARARGGRRGARRPSPQ